MSQQQYYFIGEAAGKVYKTLEVAGEAAVFKLQKESGVTDTALFNQALGWLAREGKISFRKSGKDVTVSLAVANV